MLMSNTILLMVLPFGVGHQLLANSVPEASDLFVHGSHGVRRADVDLDVTGGPPCDHDVMSSRQEPDNGAADGAGATNRDDAHECSLR
jgi:hypothetical protein